MAKSVIRVQSVSGRSDGGGIDMDTWVMYDPLEDDNYIPLVHQTLIMPTADLEDALDSSKVEEDIGKAIKKAKKDKYFPTPLVPPSEPDEWEQNDLDAYYTSLTTYQTTLSDAVTEAETQAARMDTWVDTNKGGYPADFEV